MDYRSMFDTRYLGAWDLDGADRTLRIARVLAETLPPQGHRPAQKKAVVYLEGAAKPLLCNKTNARAIAALYGNDTAKWVGELVTLYATQTDMAGETVDCIRVRPAVPRERPRSLELRPVDPDMRARQNRAAAAVEAQDAVLEEDAYDLA
jgi:hypothetical protein